ncbi:MAG: hypothetical protein QM704_21515 [Anaeromyxobacteraceae bacterium]
MPFGIPAGVRFYLLDPDELRMEPRSTVVEPIDNPFGAERPPYQFFKMKDGRVGFVNLNCMPRNY